MTTDQKLDILTSRRARIDDMPEQDQAAALDSLWHDVRKLGADEQQQYRTAVRDRQRGYD